PLDSRDLSSLSLRQDNQDKPDTLARMLEWLAVRHSEESLAQRAYAAAEPEREAPAAKPIEVYRCHCRLEGAARERQSDSGGKFHPRRYSRRSRQRHKRRPIDLRGEQPLETRLLVHLRLAGQHPGRQSRRNHAPARPL